MKILSIKPHQGDDTVSVVVESPPHENLDNQTHLTREYWKIEVVWAEDLGVVVDRKDTLSTNEVSQ